MAYEHVLKMLVGGLENTASDFEKLARLLNLRVQFRGMNKRFIPAEYRPPGPRYPKKEESASKAAASASTNLDWLAQVNTQVFSRHLHYSTGVSWKDSKGIHWDQWVE